MAVSSIWTKLRRLRQSPRFPYLVFLFLVLAAASIQIFHYWWGVQIDQMLSGGTGSSRRIAMFPPSWKTPASKPYLDPIEPITQISLNGRPKNYRAVVTAEVLRKLKWLPFLDTLNIYGDLEADGWEALGELRQLKSLSVLGLSEPGCDHLANLTRLEKVWFTVHGHNTATSFACFSNLPHLKELHLHFTIHGNSDSDPRFQAMMREFASLHQLVKIHATSMEDAILLAISSPLPDGTPPLCNLKELRLDSEMITNRGLSNLHQFPSLIHLDLSNSKVTNDGLETLKSVPYLRTLYLSNCFKITDEGLDHIAEMTNLESLNLGNTIVTPEGLLKLGTLKRLRKLRVDSPHYDTNELRLTLPPACKIVTH